MNKVRIFDLKYDASFREKFHKGVDQILDEGFLSNHTYVKKFEESYSSFNNSDHAIAVSSGTAAIEVALRSISVEDKFVIVPTNTFIATAVAVFNVGAKLLPVDIENDFFGINPDHLESLIKMHGDQIGAVVAVHIGGHISPHFQTIIEICEKNNIPVVEDAAHVHGAILNGINAGNFGTFGCFSLFTTKVMTTGEGGVVVTNCPQNQDIAKSIRQFGMCPDNSIMHNRPGSNYKMGEFQALMGCLELERIEERISKRRLIAQKYQQLLNPEKFYLPKDTKNSKGSYYKQIVVPKISQTRVNTLKEKLSSAGIALTGGVYFIPLHRQDIIKNSCNDSDFPNANQFCPNHLCPPCYPEMELEQVDYICQIMNDA